MATSEIEKLERRYAENPHGLTFAPLAEVHRKNGDVTRALELLHIGLELHPNYIPASIVLGRCHQDLGDLPAAAEAFAHVLRLDDENVIALKSLADINERQDRLDDAERWLRRLVVVDRSNEEAKQQLQRVEAAREKVGRSAPAPAVSDAVKEVPHEIARIEATPPAPAPAPAVPVARTEPAEIAPLDLTDDLKKKEAVDPVLEPAALEDRARPAPLDGLVLEPPAPVAAAPTGQLPGLETAEFEPPRGPLEPLGLEIETESDVVLNSSGASEFTVPDASQDFAALAAKLNASRPRSPGRRASDRAAVEPRETAAKAGQTPAAAESRPAVAAEQTNPPAAPPPVAEAPPAPAPPPTAYSARASNGQSIAAFFQVLLLARPPADSGATLSVQGGAIRPDQAPHDTSEPGKNTPSPVSSPPGSGKDDLVSFDDFFGSSGGRSVTASGEPGKDDLDQFHTWLQNLKR
jgi:tetratricopeptide (TPR) repeat protein